MTETWSGRVKVETLFEVICAIHLSSYVDSPFAERGGLILIGPPGALKTTLLETLNENYHNAYSISNLNTQTLMRMQGQLAGDGTSLVIPDLQALYAGDPRTASRLENSLMQLAGEGSMGASWQDTRFQKFRSRAGVFSATTPKHFERKAPEWEDSGFLRRFIWCFFRLSDPGILMDAIQKWERSDLGSIKFPEIPANGEIPDSLTEKERSRIRFWLKHQPGPHEIRFQILCKAASVIRWNYKRRHIDRDSMHTLKGFAETLQNVAAEVVI